MKGTRVDSADATRAAERSNRPPWTLPARTVDSAGLPVMPGLAESQTGRRTRISTTKEISSWTLPASGVDFADDLHVRFFCRIRRLVKVVPWTLAEQSNYTEQILLQIA